MPQRDDPARWISTQQGGLRRRPGYRGDGIVDDALARLRESGLCGARAGHELRDRGVGLRIALDGARWRVNTHVTAPIRIETNRLVSMAKHALVSI